MKNFFRNIFSILNPQEKREFFSLIFLEVLITLLDLLFLAILIVVVGYYTGTLNVEKFPPAILEVVEGHPLILVGGFLFLFALKNLLGFFVFRKQFHYVYAVASRLSEDNLQNFLDGSYTDFVNIDSAAHTRRISQQTIEFSHHVLRGAQQVISNSILVLLTVVTIVFIDALLFGMLLVMLLPAVILIAFYTRRRLVHIREAARVQRERSIQYLNEALAGFIETNIYDRKKFFRDRYAKAQQKFNEGLAQQLVMQNLPSRMMEVFAVFGLFLLVVINTYIFESNSLLLQIGAFMAAAYKIIPGIVKILNHVQQVRIFSYTIAELQKEERVRQESVPLPDTPLAKIEFVNLNFSYDTQPVLKKLNLKIEAGQMTGLSAPSGEGKTTLLHILLGFLEQSSGEIYFNDHKASQGERRSWWPRIAYAPQQNFIIHDSIQNNIALNEEPDMKALWNAVTSTGLHTFIADSERGLDTVITENGKNLSGGQRQRMIMARAIYRDADLYIFDEPFSELDKEGAATLLKFLQSLSENGKMVILISHDPATLQFCSKIIRLHAS